MAYYIKTPTSYDPMVFITAQEKQNKTKIKQQHPDKDLEVENGHMRCIPHCGISVVHKPLADSSHFNLTCFHSCLNWVWIFF